MTSSWFLLRRDEEEEEGSKQFHGHMMMIFSPSSSGSRLSSVRLSALCSPLLSVPRRLSGLSVAPDVPPGDPVVDRAAGARAGGQDMVLEDREDGRVGAETEGAAADGERRRPAADHQDGSGRGQQPVGLLQLDCGLHAETWARSAAHPQQPDPKKQAAKKHQRKEPHVHKVTLLPGWFLRPDGLMEPSDQSLVFPC